MDFRKTAIVLLGGVFFVSSYVRAEIVSASFYGTVIAEFEDELEMNSSSQTVASTSVFASEDNSHTESNLVWTWEEARTYGELVGESNLIGEMSDGVGAGGSHHASSNLAFEFAVDAVSEVAFSGSLFIEGDSADADIVGFSFESESTTLFSDSTAGNGGLASGSFSYTRIIEPGTYTMEFYAELFELIDAPEIAVVGWKLDGLVISEVQAVPDSNSATFLLLGILLAAMSRKLE